MKKKPLADPWLFTTDEDKEKTYRLETSKDLDPLMERIGDAHFVLLGEASHGTHEYYTWRSAITRRLVKEKGFRFIAVEGDWPDCYRLNRYIKGYDAPEKNAADVLRSFRRWPTWMWANWEIAALAEWMKEHNHGLSAQKRVGFYGLDVYSLWESMEVLIRYLEKNDPQAAKYAKEAMRCFEYHGRDEMLYAGHARSVPDDCRKAALELLVEVNKRSIFYDHDPEAALNTEQNAHIAVGAERYYHSMMSFNDDSWNIRDTHMVDTLHRLVDFHGEGSKCVIWEHNTHIGDARYTDMVKAGMHNVGQLVREAYGESDAVLVGFGCYSGKVMAGRAWGAEMEEMNVPVARKSSVETLLHGEGSQNRLLIFDRENEKERFRKTLPHRAIGVVYHPEAEYHNYVPSQLNGRYDAFIYLDETKAVHALHFKPDSHLVPETYPFEF